MERDPVCGMIVVVEKTEHESDYNGAHYYFCSNVCKGEFDTNPEKFVREENA